jgi:hypothetical protein
LSDKLVGFAAIKHSKPAIDAVIFEAVDASKSLIYDSLDNIHQKHRPTNWLPLIAGLPHDKLNRLP